FPSARVEAEARMAPSASLAPLMRTAPRPAPAAQPPAAAPPSAVGHTLGHAITGDFSGGRNAEPSNPDITYREPHGSQLAQQHQVGPCFYEMKHFLECAQNQTDIKLCEGFNEVLKQCKLANGLS
uniref:Coiled-coil-helix-coiled-coil-helix domain containing 2 n=1 Tax=Otolemur garnettii TaxID=30611 RepID=H0XPJ0_OTOGA